MLRWRRLNEKTLFDEVVESFKVMDRDGDGYLERLELKRILMVKSKAGE